MTATAQDCLPGVDYFPEHWPKERWQRDAELMRECGLKVVRIAEFSWSKTQPTVDVWDWSWLDEAVSILAGAGLKIILCTPTACPPPWFVQEFPDVLPVLPDGKTMTLGHRRHYSPHHQAYRLACADFAQKLATRYGSHPDIIGFQIDNELHGLMEDTGPLARSAFQAWLKQRHGTLQQLDANLGLVFWGLQYSNWSQIPVPRSGSYHPSLRSEWRRFVSAAWVDFCNVQAEVMRPWVHGRILTTNCFLHRWGMQIDWSELMKNGGLNLFSFDNYSNELHENGYYNHLASSLSPVYWCLEQRCGDTQHNHIWPEPAVSMEQLSFETAKAGARVMTYFRWRQGLFGQEQDHGAILDHHGRPGSMFQRVKQLTSVLAQATDVPPSACTGIVFSWVDAWFAECSPNPIQYRDLLLDVVYKAVFTVQGCAKFIFDPDALVSSRLKLLILPLKLEHTPAWEDALLHYVSQGGTVLCLPLLFAKDPYNKYRPEPFSPVLGELLGFDLERRILVRPGHAVHASLPDGSVVAFDCRLEELVPLSGQLETVLCFSDGPVANRPALVRHSYGAGQVWYAAGYPDAEGLKLLLQLIIGWRG